MTGTSGVSGASSPRRLGVLGVGFVWALAALLLGVLAGCDAEPADNQLPTATPAPTFTPTVTATPSPTATHAPTATASSGYPVQVFFSRHPDSDSDSSKVFAVARVSPTLGVATYAINQLIAGPTSSESAQGYYTELTTVLSGTSNCSGAAFTITLDHKGATAETGTVTLKFCKMAATSGIGTDARITAEIAKTLLQFSNNHKVVILTRDGHCFGDESGMDICLN